VLATGANSPFKTLADFVVAAKAKPGTLNVGTINIGSTQNLSAELLKTTAGIDFVIVPFRGTPEVLVSLLQGNIALMIDGYSAIKGNLADGKIRALAVSGAARSESTPIFPARRKPASPIMMSSPGMRCSPLAARRRKSSRRSMTPCMKYWPTRRQKTATRAWHRSEGGHAIGDCGEAEIRHRQVAEGDREGWNPKAVARGSQMCG